MKIKEIQLENFRSYKHVEIHPNPYINIFLGKNASGKTNLLEAISMLISGKSFRTYLDKETLMFGADEYKIRALINMKGLDKDYEMTYNPKSKKDISINLTKVASLRDLRRDAPLVTFVPEDLEIVKKGPSLRRRFVDEGSSGLDLIYRYNLSKYNQILRQKNDLLKSKEHKLDKNMLLNAYNIQLASLGAYIINSRKKYVERLNETIGDIHPQISNGEDLKLVYKNPHVDYENIKQLEVSIYREFERSKPQDIFRRTSTTGLQRDDYDIILDGILARDYGSQGQQRNIVLSMKLAQLQLLKESKNIQPILLLDDVFSELDMYRRKRLIKYMENLQVFITMAETKYVEEFKNVNRNIYIIKDDEVRLMKGD